MGSPGRTWRCQLIPPRILFRALFGDSGILTRQVRYEMRRKKECKPPSLRSRTHHGQARPPKPAGGANMRLGMAGMLTWGNLGTFGCLISCILPDPDSLVIVSRILASHAKEHSRSGTPHATWVFILCCPADCCPCPATSAGYQSAGPGTE
ncbi:hypothetical protein EDB80DRAFT_168968 [Ilyonectria destructans]|nr:hypothetical protein EDB80DRAFT_168968 [Ilyonectria destructans]